MISSKEATLPLLTTTPSAENTSSVVGARLVLDSGIMDPSTSFLLSGFLSGAASSMCSEPSSDVWETFAVELAGSTTFLSRANFTAA